MNHSLPVRKILFLAANPTDTGRLRLDEEIREIEEGLKRSPGRETFELVAKWAIRIKDLRRALLEHQPHIVHFSGHGAGDDGLVLENEVGQATSIKAETLKRYFRLCPNVECVLLNACYSQVQADAIADHVPYVIGMNQAIGDNTAIQFAVGFYDALGHQRSVLDAYDWGIAAIDAEPVVIQRNIAAYPESLNLQGTDPVTPILIAAQTQKKPVVSISKQDYRNRQALLNKVRNYWIKGVLEHSLYNQVLIELGLEERLDFADPFHVTLDIGEQSHKALAPDVHIADVFDELGEGRSLLILGEPGSGKTITLLQLARDLIIQAEQDVNHLIPVVFNLSSWTGQQSIADWLVEELNTKYQVPKVIGKSWIQQQQLLLLLDGLDEVAAKHREACVVALNQFQQTLSTEMVVCSRIRDYEDLSQRLTVQQAVYVRSLNPTQIDHYLNSLNANLVGLRQLLKTDAALQELAQSPLMLNIMILTYEDASPQILPQADIEAHREQIFNAYFYRMLKRRDEGVRYSSTQVFQWLKWLAEFMLVDTETVFLIERIKSYGLKTICQKGAYTLTSSILSSIHTVSIFSIGVAIDSGLTTGIRIGLIAGLLSFVINVPATLFVLFAESISLDYRENFLLRLAYSIGAGVSEGWFIGFMFAILVNSRIGLMTGLSISCISGLTDYLTGGAFIHRVRSPVESLKWSWINIRSRLIFWTTICSIGGIIIQFLGVLGHQLYQSSIITLSLLLVGLFIGLLDGLSCPAQIESKVSPNQGIRQSAKISLIITLIGFTVLTIVARISGLPNILGATIGLIIGWYLGGAACMIHFALRLTLYCARCIPWNYAHFLDYAVKHGFLQRVGGGYIFIHRSLMEHFAQMDVAEK